MGVYAIYYHTVHIYYAVYLFIRAAITFITSPTYRRGCCRRCTRWMCRSSSSSVSLSSSSLSPFPVFCKQPQHIAIAFQPSAIYYPALPYLTLWCIQSAAATLTLYDIEGKIKLHITAFIDNLCTLAEHAQEGSTIHNTPIIVRLSQKVDPQSCNTQQILRAHPEYMQQLQRGELPSDDIVYLVYKSKHWILTPEQMNAQYIHKLIQQQHGAQEQDRPMPAQQVSMSNKKEAEGWDTQYNDKDDYDYAIGNNARLRKLLQIGNESNGIKTMNGHKQSNSANGHHLSNGTAHSPDTTTVKQNGSNGLYAPHIYDSSSVHNSQPIANGHNHYHPPLQQPHSVFIINILDADDSMEPVVSSTIQLALPHLDSLPRTSMAKTSGFPPPSSTVAPAHLLRDHVLQHALPAPDFPLAEPELLLLFADPLSVLSFPPWLQRLSEIIHVSPWQPAVMDRRDFIEWIERYSHRVQRNGT